MKNRGGCSEAKHNSCPRRGSKEPYQLKTSKKLTQDSNKENTLIREYTSQLLKDKSCYAVHCHDSYRSGATHYPYECPVEIQSQEPLLSEDKDTKIEQMEKEFMAKRKILITGLPHDGDEESLKSFFKEFSCIPVSKVKDGTVRVLFNTAAKAKDSIALLNSTMFKCHKLSASYGHADSLLFVGNLPFTYTRDDLASLFKPHGEILRCLLVHSPKTGLSKGYGFVEYAKREEALFAKQKLATKVIGLRSLRVDFSDNGMQTCEDLHSQTLFVDRLPKGFKDDVALKAVFSQHGRVNFCQVATSPGTGVSRGFAFIDMSTSEEAELAQVGCNGFTFFGQDIRVSFGMPCRHGACILQHKSAAPFKGTILPSLKPFTTTKLATQFYQSGDVSHGGGIAPSYSDSCLHFSGPHHQLLPLRELNTDVPSRLPVNIADSFPFNEYLPIQEIKDVGLSKSRSAPSVLNPHTCSQLQQHNTPLHTMYSDSSYSHQCEGKDSHHFVLGKKRPLSLEVNVPSGIYDKAYIGQHQQGIPFTHPLKRIRMED